LYLHRRSSLGKIRRLSVLSISAPDVSLDFEYVGRQYIQFQNEGVIMGKGFLLTKNKEEIIKDIYEQAYRTQMNYRGCSQIVVKALMDHFGVYSQEVLRAATPFAGGVARTGGTPCGALAGGIMGVGLYCGRNDLREAGPPKELRGEGPLNPYDKSHTLAAELIDRFKEFWGTTVCYEIQEKLLGRTMNVRDPEVQELMKTGEYFDMLSKVCCNVSASAARMAAEIILEDLEEERNWYRFDQSPDLDYKPPER
jgi:C_GCAxxG_C_C family probable redox protein